jgi:hypothetical protein
VTTVAVDVPVTGPAKVSAPGSVAAALRPHPYPYRAMLAITSDLDETPDVEAYLESLRYLNTRAITSIGRGVGLEVGNSIYFDMAPDQFSYWNTDEAGRERLRALIRSGHVDCLHSFGDLAITRAHAGRALDELAHHACRLRVWVDHAVAPTNFGADIMAGHGDVPGSPVYHADLTCGFGIRFVSRGRVTSVIGQDVPRSLAGLLTPRHPVRSADTWAKELAKGLLARSRNAKYAMHGHNATLRPVRLRSGHPVQEMLRSNPHWGGVSSADTADGLSDVLTTRVLDTLVERGGRMLLYTHLGKTRAREPFAPPTRAALERLAAYHDRGAVLVTTTARLLAYRYAVEGADVSASSIDGQAQIDITVRADVEAADLQGLTVYTPHADTARVHVNAQPVSILARNPPDETGRASVSIPRVPLAFPL